MGFIDKLNDARSWLAKEVRLFNASETAPDDSMPFLAQWFWTAKLGMPRNVNIAELRQFEKSCWVQMVHNAILRQLRTTDWDVVTSDEEDETDYYKDIEQVLTLLKYPNRNGDGFWDVWSPAMKDVLTIDAGVVFKGRKNGKLVELFPHDGSKFLFDVDEHGLINGYYQYSYRYPKGTPKWFEKNDIVYCQINRTTEQYPYSWSPMQSILQETELLIQGTRYNKEAFQNNAIPDGIVTVPMEKNQMERFKNGWKQETRGKAHKLVFHNVQGTNFTDLRKSNVDMQWLDGQKWYFHLVFGVYGLSPQEVGFYENSNRATGESQERVSIRNAIMPYYALIEDKINREIIPELVGHDKIKFKFFPFDSSQEKAEHDQIMAKLNANVYTINEVRKREGLEPVAWGDQPMSMVMQDRMVEMGGGQFGDNEDNNDDESSDREKQRDKSGSHVIAIGARGGRIVGYMPDGKPIYEGGKNDPNRKRPPKSHEEKLKAYAESKWRVIPEHHKATIAANVEKFKSGKDTHGEHYKDGKWSPERQAHHKKIISDYVEQAKRAKSTGTPEVVFMAGLPASGKTYATQKEFKKVPDSKGKLLEDYDGNKYLVLNADDIKEYFPEYDNGLGAAVVHNESSVLNSHFIEQFSNQNVNIIIDGTLAKTDKAEQQLKMFHNKGYSSRLIFVDVPAKVSIDRAESRYKQIGRFVPYDLIASYDSKVRASVDRMKIEVDSYVRVDNSGTTPTVVEEANNRGTNGRYSDDGVLL